MAHADVTDGLVGWWKFDEAAGNAVDSSGHAITGTPIGTTILTSGCKRGNCRQFNGTSDYISVPYATLDFENTDPVSFAFWANWNNSVPVGGINAYIGRLLSGNLGTVVYNCKAAIGGECNGNSLGFLMMHSSGSYLLTSTPMSSFLSNVWNHVVVTYSGNALVSGVKIYINGVNQTLTNFHDNLAGSIKPNVNWRIGDDTTNDWFGGSMDDVRIYNRVLSQAEVQAIYNAGTPRVTIKGSSKIRGLRIN